MGDKHLLMGDYSEKVQFLWRVNRFLEITGSFIEAHHQLVVPTTS